MTVWKMAQFTVGCHSTILALCAKPKSLCLRVNKMKTFEFLSASVVNKMGAGSAILIITIILIIGYVIALLVTYARNKCQKRAWWFGQYKDNDTNVNSACYDQLWGKQCDVKTVPATGAYMYNKDSKYAALKNQVDDAKAKADPSCVIPPAKKEGFSCCS